MQLYILIRKNHYSVDKESRSVCFCRVFLHFLDKTHHLHTLKTGTLEGAIDVFCDHYDSVVRVRVRVRVRVTLLHLFLQVGPNPSLVSNR